LLVDDDETTNFLNKFFLRQLDSSLEVNVATNGQEAIELLLAQKNRITPCLLILDTHMPVMDGWEFLKIFEKELDADIKSRITIVMLVTFDADKSAEKAVSNPNVADVAEKPLSDLKFRALITKHFF